MIYDEFGRKIDARAKRLARRQIRARWDAAQTSDENSAHWANADDLSAAAAGDPAVLKSLRSRARYECIENNSYGQGIVSTLTNDVIGTGPQLQMELEDDVANKVVEDEFHEWARQVRFAERLRTSKTSKTVSGEGVIRLVTNMRLRNDVKLALRVYEPDQLTSSYGVNLINDQEVDGILYDEFGNPKTYQLLKQHPGSTVAVLNLEPEPVPAEQVIHLFREDRPGQGRGVPEVAPALPLFAMLRRYSLAVLAAAETAADFAGVMFTDSPTLDSPADVDAFDAIPMERRVMLTLPAGWQMGQIDAKQPTTTYEMFKNAILNEIARGFNMPFNVAAGNSAGYNFASGRLDHKVYFRSIEVERAYFELVCLDVILSAWLDEALLIPGLLPGFPPGLRRVPHSWRWPGIIPEDLVKEANAQKIRLENKTTTLAAEYGSQGKDWEAELEQIAREDTKKKELKIGQSPVPAPVGPGEDEDEDEDEDEEE